MTHPKLQNLLKQKEERIEKIDVNSGDSECSQTPYYIGKEVIRALNRKTTAMVHGLLELEDTMEIVDERIKKCHPQSDS